MTTFDELIDELRTVLAGIDEDRLEQPTIRRLVTDMRTALARYDAAGEARPPPGVET